MFMEASGEKYYVRQVFCLEMNFYKNVNPLQSLHKNMLILHLYLQN